MFKQNANKTLHLIKFVTFIIVASLISISHGSQDPINTPQEITENLSCGKCGMFPAKYPKWQTQVVFTDGAMAPFDGCKCMFGFLFKMNQFDQQHTAGDVASIWVREFNSGDWIDAKEAHYVIGSDEMGPMGKELIPFSNIATAETFQKEHGGNVAMYDSISMETLKPLMGKMNMKGHMDM